MMVFVSILFLYVGALPETTVARLIMNATATTIQRGVPVSFAYTSTVRLTTGPRGHYFPYVIEKSTERKIALRNQCFLTEK
jgi:hypothetical protein